ncbi:PAP2 superfamily protein [Geodermatophilus africanus]|uniref:PAP2 superfamily protein n=1 Tax=Geodermatophilus africanus TaxID=1137993 RepID=A0A1H3AK07_9ACTN|nr:vanadium-dependent haloperoxidase [Geodermatophilus africanus]SDX30037.1 PAP2 superfamily protein [Geodermatophilus africanus]
MNQPVLYWNEALLEANARDHTPGQRPEHFTKPVETRGPTGSSWAFAIVHLAMRDAARAACQPSAPTYTGVQYAGPFTGTAQHAAIAAAAQCTLAALWPEYEDYFTEHATKDPMPHGPGRAEGHRLGVEAATRLLDLRAGDGAGDQPHYATSPGYGRHRVDPVNPGQPFVGPQWGNVAHFVLPGHVHLDPPPGYELPDFLADAHYLADHREVRELGVRSGGTRTPEETLIGVFWAYDGVAEIGTPPRLYNQFLRKIVELKGSSTKDQAELFALANVAMADAAIEAWRWKYHHDLWRPVIGVREAASSNGPSGQAGVNSDPECDPFWVPLGAPNSNQSEAPDFTPPFPAYPSGHATFGAAVFQMVRLFYGGAPITVADVVSEDPPPPEFEPVDLVSDELNGTTTDSSGVVRVRHVRRFTDLVTPIRENSLSRVYLGVHWRFDGLPRCADDNIGGVPLGLQIAQQVKDAGLVPPPAAP